MSWMDIRNTASRKAIQAQIRVWAGTALCTERRIASTASVAAPEAFSGCHQCEIVRRVFGVMLRGVLVAFKALRGVRV
jgi:hypothetical protein